MPERSWIGMMRNESPYYRVPVDQPCNLRAIGPVQNLNVVWARDINTSSPTSGRMNKYIIPEKHKAAVENSSIFQSQQLTIRPSYAVCVFDLDTFEKDKKISILELGRSFFSEIIEPYNRNYGRQIGSSDGPHIRIIKTGNGINTRYNYIVRRPNYPLTRDMLNFIVRTNNEEFQEAPITRRGIIDLEKYYFNSTSLEKINSYFNLNLTEKTDTNTSKDFEEPEESNELDDMQYINFLEI